MGKIVEILNDESIKVDGEIWYTGLGYNRALGYSLTSTKQPYDHVFRGKAEKLHILSATFFRPISK